MLRKSGERRASVLMVTFIEVISVGILGVVKRDANAYIDDTHIAKDFISYRIMQLQEVRRMKKKTLFDENTRSKHGGAG